MKPETVIDAQVWAQVALLISTINRLKEVTENGPLYAESECPLRSPLNHEELSRVLSEHGLSMYSRSWDCPLCGEQFTDYED